MEALILLLLRWDCLDAAAAIVKRNLKRVSKHMRAQSQFEQGPGARNASVVPLVSPRRLTRLAFFVAFSKRCALATRRAAVRAELESQELGRDPSAVIKGRRRTLQWCMSAMVNVFRFYQETDPTFCQPRGRQRGVKYVHCDRVRVVLCLPFHLVLSIASSPARMLPDSLAPLPESRRPGGRLTAADASVDSIGREHERGSEARADTDTRAQSPLAEACTGVFPSAVFRPELTIGEQEASGEAANGEGADTKDVLRKEVSLLDPLEEEINAAEVQAKAMFGFLRE